MKSIFLLVILFSCCLSSKAQLVFRNIGSDTLHLAVATYYDTSRKAMNAEEGKSVMVKGWYLLRPGDSLNYGAFFGPAIYYCPEIIRNKQDYGYNSEAATGNKIFDFREQFFVDNSRAWTDTTKFKYKHPYVPLAGSQKEVLSSFRVIIVPAEAKKTHRLLVKLGKIQKD